MRILFQLTTAITLSILLAACTTGTINNDQSIENALDRLNLDRDNVVNSVPNFRLSGWRLVNNRNLIVTAGLHNHYLLSLDAPCQDLNFAFGIGLQNRGISLQRGDSIVINSLHQNLESCRIDQITRLTDRNQ